MVENLRHIRAFIAVARSGNFTRAASTLHLSQSALTVQIQQLEASLGVKILDRDKRSCRLTLEGARLVAPMEQMLLNAEALSGVAQGNEAGASGFVAIASVPSLVADLLPRVIASFYQKFPLARVRLRDMLSEKVIGLVTAGDVDFGLSGYSGMHRDLLFVFLRRSRLCAYMYRNHPLVRRNTITLKELCELPLILTERPSSFRTTFESAVEKAQLSFHLAFEVTQLSTAFGLASAGLGVAVLSESAQALIHSENIVRVEIASPVIPRSIHVVRRRDRPLSPTADAFLRELRAMKSETKTAS